jgi:hypothetical protein
MVLVRAALARNPQLGEIDKQWSVRPGLASVAARESSPVLQGAGPRPDAVAADDENPLWRREGCRGPACGDASRQTSDAYWSAWTTVPLCSVTMVALANHAGAAEDISGQFSVVSCQCLAMPAGDS